MWYKNKKTVKCNLIYGSIFFFKTVMIENIQLLSFIFGEVNEWVKGGPPKPNDLVIGHGKWLDETQDPLLRGAFGEVFTQQWRSLPSIGRLLAEMMNDMRKRKRMKSSNYKKSCKWLLKGHFNLKKTLKLINMSACNILTSELLHLSSSISTQVYTYKDKKVKVLTMNHSMQNNFIWTMIWTYPFERSILL